MQIHIRGQKNPQKKKKKKSNVLSFAAALILRSRKDVDEADAGFFGFHNSSASSTTDLLSHKLPLLTETQWLNRLWAQSLGTARFLDSLHLPVGSFLLSKTRVVLVPCVADSLFPVFHLQSPIIITNPLVLPRLSGYRFDRLAVN
jgi:hypothetical protein